MQLNSIPTDSLHKFCALLGLSLLIFNTYYIFEMSHSSKIKEIELQLEYDKFYIDLKYQTTKSKQLAIDLKSYKKKLEYNVKQLISINNHLKLIHNGVKPKMTLDEKELIYLTNRNSKIDSLIKSQKEQISSLLLNHYLESEKVEILEKEILAKKLILNEETNKLLKYKIFLIVGIFIGFSLTIYGFYQWYNIEKKQNIKS